MTNTTKLKQQIAKEAKAVLAAQQTVDREIKPNNNEEAAA